MTIGIVAGEASGDALAATLIHAVRRRLPQARFVGVAGPRMEAAGCEAWYPLEMLAVRGLVEVLSRLPQLFAAAPRALPPLRCRARSGVRRSRRAGLQPRAREEVEARRRAQPASRQSVGVGLAPRTAANDTAARSIGCSRCSLSSPRSTRPPEFRSPSSAIRSPPKRRELGSRREARDQLKLGAAQPVFALLPGSRSSELEMHGDLVLRAAEALHAMRPDARFLVPLATRPTRDRFEAAIYRLGLEKLPLTLLYGHATDALRAADVALVASGTATLEAALARCPHVIFYRLNALTAGIVRRRLLLPWVGLPNILAGKFVVPEMLQEDATAENLAQAAANLYDDMVTRRRLEALFAGFAASLAVDTGSVAAEAVAGELRAAGVPC